MEIREHAGYLINRAIQVRIRWGVEEDKILIGPPILELAPPGAHTLKLSLLLPLEDLRELARTLNAAADAYEADMAVEDTAIEHMKAEAENRDQQKGLN